MSFASPAQIAAIAVALVWPFAVALALVLWTKTRAVRRQRQIAALEGGLKGMFRAVASEGVPARMAFVIDALEEGVELAPAPVRSRAPAH